MIFTKRFKLFSDGIYSMQRGLRQSQQAVRAIKNVLVFYNAFHIFPLKSFHLGDFEPERYDLSQYFQQITRGYPISRYQYQHSVFFYVFFRSFYVFLFFKFEKTGLFWEKVRFFGKNRLISPKNSEKVEKVRFFIFEKKKTLPSMQA